MTGGNDVELAPGEQPYDRLTVRPDPPGGVRHRAHDHGAQIQTGVVAEPGQGLLVAPPARHQLVERLQGACGVVELDALPGRVGPEQFTLRQRLGDAFGVVRTVLRAPVAQEWDVHPSSVSFVPPCAPQGVAGGVSAPCPWRAKALLPRAGWPDGGRDVRFVPSPYESERGTAWSPPGRRSWPGPRTTGTRGRWSRARG